MPVRHRFPSPNAAPAEVLPHLVRPKSVRAKIVALLTVPVIALMALWALATVSAVQSAWTLHQVKDLDADLVGPVGDLVDSLQAERAAVAQYLAAPGGAGADAISVRRARTAAATTTLLDGATVARADIANLTPEVSQRIAALVRDLDSLQNDREPIVALHLNWDDAYTAYTSAIEDAFAVDEVLTKVQQGSAAAAAQVVLQLGRIAEMIARQDAVAISAQATGQMTAQQYYAFADALGGEHVLTVSVLPSLTAADQTAYQQLVNDDAYRALTTMQNAVLGTGGHNLTVIPADQWRGAVQFVTQGLSTLRTNASAAAAAEVDSSSGSAVTQAALTAILGLLAVLLGLVVSVQIGRGLVIELVELRDSALELANRRLPQAMRRLRAGEKIDITADVPVVAPGDGEIGEVGAALNAVQHAALRAAAERAELLTGVSGVFVNLARRTQSLVHRQLDMLDKLERQTEDPATLEDLFRLDHMATRMRRHAEGLIIMSGAAPGRAWSRPVPLTNVIRSAIAEVEDYARVEMRRMPELSVPGSVVSDLTHLTAELVENATSFSPPDTTVLVHGEPVGAGFVVEIEDRGLGMSQERMAEANRRIADAHQVDLFDSDRLGLFVVSRLANRQNISVSLRRSPYGGTTAVVLLPTSILMMSEPAQDRQLTWFAPFTSPEDEAAPRAVTAPAPMADHQTDPTLRPVQVRPEPAGPNNDEEATGGLPRRRRQENLAPGLRAAAPGGTEEPEAIAAPVPPEQVHAMMSAFQQGFVRGRSTDVTNS
jgi:signal transduction histidine kinase